MSYKADDILLNKYRIESPVGRCAFAMVYNVTHLRLHAPRAVKVLRMEMPGVGSRDFRDMRQRSLVGGLVSADDQMLTFWGVP